MRASWQTIAARFTGNYRIRFHFAPPILNRGTPVKRSFGPWMNGVFRLLVKLKFLRGTPFDVFGYTNERRMERALVEEYGEMVRDLSAQLSRANHATATEIEKRERDGHVGAKRDSIKAILPVIPETARTFRSQCKQ